MLANSLSFYLTENGLGDQGAICISNALKANHTLTELSLCSKVDIIVSEVVSFQADNMGLSR